MTSRLARSDLSNSPSQKEFMTKVVFCGVCPTQLLVSALPIQSVATHGKQVTPFSRLLRHIEDIASLL